VSAGAGRPPLFFGGGDRDFYISWTLRSTKKKEGEMGEGGKEREKEKKKKWEKREVYCDITVGHYLLTYLPSVLGPLLLVLKVADFRAK